MIYLICFLVASQQYDECAEFETDTWNDAVADAIIREMGKQYGSATITITNVTSGESDE